MNLKSFVGSRLLIAHPYKLFASKIAKKDLSLLASNPGTDSLLARANLWLMTEIPPRIAFSKKDEFHGLEAETTRPVYVWDTRPNYTLAVYNTVPDRGRSCPCRPFWNSQTRQPATIHLFSNSGRGNLWGFYNPIPSTRFALARNHHPKCPPPSKNYKMRLLGVNTSLQTCRTSWNIHTETPLLQKAPFRH